MIRATHITSKGLSGKRISTNINAPTRQKQGKVRELCGKLVFTFCCVPGSGVAGRVICNGKKQPFKHFNPSSKKQLFQALLQKNNIFHAVIA